MASDQTRRHWRAAVYVVPLCFVIAAALVWSSYATYHNSLGPKVPGFIAWTMFVTLDGAVVVTTPVMLSTILKWHSRLFAALIGGGALVWSMFINHAEAGWKGVAPPLFAGLLIHLVGHVLRDFARGDEDADPVADGGPKEIASDAPVFAPEPVSVPTPPARREVVLGPVHGPELPPVLGPVPPAPPAQPVTTATRSAADLARKMLNDAYSRDVDLPGGAAITRACREAGFPVGDNYGRSFLNRWRAEHPGAREAVKV